MTLWKPGIDLSNKAKPLQAGGPSKLPTTYWLVLAFLITGAWILPVRSALAEVQTITASHTYVMGDNDSRNDARQLCFLEAKRKVLEKAGSFIQSHSVVDNFNLTKDQITSYSAAVLSVETVKEDVGSRDRQNSLTCTVKAEVDVAQVKQLVAAIIADKGLQDRIAKQERQVRQLDEQVQSLNSRLSGAPVSSTGEFRKERTVMLENIAELDRVAMVARERMSDENESIRQKTRIILKYVENGMTSDEVIKLLGQPFKKIRIVNENWYYGRLWICFDEPLRAGDYRVRWVVGDDMCLDSSARG